MTFSYRKRAQDIFTYPEDLGEHYIMFSFVTYARSNPAIKSLAELENVIALPIPVNLSETVGLEWEAGEMNPYVDATVAFFAGGDESNFEGSLDLAKARQAEETGSDDSSFNAAKQRVALNLPGVSDNYSSLSGNAINPNIALVFKGQTGTREHSFSWKFVPQSAHESKLIGQIVNEFRYQALPNKENDHIIKYPNECYIALGGSELGYLPFYKLCVITGVTVNYAPDGTPAFYRGTGAPAAVQLDITLKETTQLMRQDLEVAIPGSTSVGKKGSGVIGKALGAQSPAAPNLQPLEEIKEAEDEKLSLSTTRNGNFY